jgi:hypothetical protein
MFNGPGYLKNKNPGRKIYTESQFFYKDTVSKDTIKRLQIKSSVFNCGILDIATE